MNAILTWAAALTLLWSANAWALATISLNNYDSRNPIALCGYDSRPVGLVPVQGTYVELVTPAGPVRDIATQSSIIPLTEDGFFFGSVGIVPGVPDYATAEFTLRIWRSGPTWEAATQRESVTWTQATGSWDPNHDPPAPPTGAVLQNPVACFYIPEPGIIALGVMGGAVLWLLRPKQ